MSIVLFFKPSSSIWPGFLERGVCRCISNSFPVLQRLLWAVDLPRATSSR
jgi:hypothetical protein